MKAVEYLVHGGEKLQKSENYWAQKCLNTETGAEKRKQGKAGNVRRACECAWR